ncbi:unnamed protein product [Caenorhabditis sp. 36 PRJEB53466]|nr:unnamed protein product [Caenorhabditis sp. 36 PRJEB53466]
MKSVSDIVKVVNNYRLMNPDLPVRVKGGPGCGLTYFLTRAAVEMAVQQDRLVVCQLPCRESYRAFRREFEQFRTSSDFPEELKVERAVAFKGRATDTVPELTTQSLRIMIGIANPKVIEYSSNLMDRRFVMIIDHLDLFINRDVQMVLSDRFPVIASFDSLNTIQNPSIRTQIDFCEHHNFVHSDRSPQMLRWSNRHLYSRTIGTIHGLSEFSERIVRAVDTTDGFEAVRREIREIRSHWSNEQVLLVFGDQHQLDEYRRNFYLDLLRRPEIRMSTVQKAQFLPLHDVLVFYTHLTVPIDEHRDALPTLSIHTVLTRAAKMLVWIGNLQVLRDSHRFEIQDLHRDLMANASGN